MTAEGSQVKLGERLRLSPEVAGALSSGRPVVALESTIISHGLPRPRNLEVAQELEEIVRRSTLGQIEDTADDAMLGTAK